MEIKTDFSELPHEVFERSLKEILSTHFSYISDYEIEISAGSKKGDNLLGIIFRIVVKSKKDENSKVNLILKTSPQHIARRAMFLTHDIFKRESEFYHEVFPIYLKFQENKQVGLEGFHHVPICYKSLYEEPNEGQFFEDLSLEGFSLHDRHKPLSNDHVLLVMKTLGKMHATFLAIKYQNPKLVEKFTKMEDLVIKIYKVENSSNYLWLNEEKVRAMKLLDQCENQDLIDKVHALLDNNILEKFEETLSGSNSEPYAVLCHGDCWNNNILYKVDDKGTPVDIRFLDFQLMRYASPATDLGYYIFGCTTKQMRDEHYQEYMDTYYNSLSETIKRLGSDPQHVFPRDAFNNQMKKFARYGILMGILLVTAIIGDASDVPNMDEICEEHSGGQGVNTQLTLLSDKTSLIYERRMMDIFQDMYDFGYI